MRANPGHGGGNASFVFGIFTGDFRHALTLFAYEQSQKPLKEALCGAEDIALIVGPEGGFSPEEAAEIEAAGADR